MQVCEASLLRLDIVYHFPVAANVSMIWGESNQLLRGEREKNTRPKKSGTSNGVEDVTQCGSEQRCDTGEELSNLCAPPASE